MSAASNPHRDLFKFIGLTLIFTLIFLLLMEQRQGPQSDPTFFPHDLRRSANLEAELQSIYAQQALDLEVESPKWSNEQQVILEEVKSIESRLGEFEQQESSLEGQSTEGGSLLSYLEADERRKTEKIFLGETGRREEVAYFKEENVIYIDSIQIDYSRPITMTDEDLLEFFYDVPEEEIPGSMKTFTESLGAHDQYFFEEGILKKWVQNGVEMDSDSEEFLERLERF